LERREASRLQPGDQVLYDQNVRRGSFDWQTYEATVLKVGMRRIKIAFAGRETWVKPWRIRSIEQSG
jgi:hypothetical protein